MAAHGVQAHPFLDLGKGGQRAAGQDAFRVYQSMAAHLANPARSELRLECSAKPAVVDLGGRLFVDGDDVACRPARGGGGADAGDGAAVTAGFIATLEDVADAPGGEQHADHPPVAQRPIRAELTPPAADIVVRRAAANDGAAVADDAAQALDDGLFLPRGLVDPDQFGQLAGATGVVQCCLQCALCAVGGIALQTDGGRSVVTVGVLHQQQPYGAAAGQEKRDRLVVMQRVVEHAQKVRRERLRLGQGLGQRCQDLCRAAAAGGVGLHCDHGDVGFLGP